MKFPSPAAGVPASSSSGTAVPTVELVTRGGVKAERVMDGVRGRLRMMGTPSTCMQFEPDAEEFNVDSRPPAYRWLELGDDGSLKTGIEWVADND